MTEAVLDRRAALEAAFDQHTQEEQAEDTPVAASQEETTSETPLSGESAPASTGEPGEKPPVATESEGEKPETPALPVDKAPQSWRGPQKAKWAALDPEVKQEVMRREREITKTLGETSQARQFANKFAQTVAPYAPRLQSIGADPLVVVNELLKSDYVLSTAPKAQRAQFMARMIKHYDIDVRELDGALAGTGPADPVGSQLEQLLNQRLAPIQQFLTAQQQREAQREQATSEELGQTLEQMAADPKYPHFDTVRDDMADVIDIAAKRGLYLSLEQAYNRAVAMNPEVSQQVAAQREAEAKKAAALASHNRAQKALRASVSVGGAPGGVPSGASPANDRRATISAAFDALMSR